MLVKNSDIYKKQILQIEKLRKQKIKMGLKSSKLINLGSQEKKVHLQSMLMTIILQCLEKSIG